VYDCSRLSTSDLKAACAAGLAPRHGEQPQVRTEGVTGGFIWYDVSLELPDRHGNFPTERGALLDAIDRQGLADPEGWGIPVASGAHAPPPGSFIVHHGHGVTGYTSDDLESARRVEKHLLDMKLPDVYIEDRHGNVIDESYDTPAEPPPQRVAGEPTEIERALMQAIEAAGFSVSGPGDVRAAEHGEPAWVCNARGALAEAQALRGREAAGQARYPEDARILAVARRHGIQNTLVHDRQLVAFVEAVGDTTRAQRDALAQALGAIANGTARDAQAVAKAALAQVAQPGYGTAPVVPVVSAAPSSPSPDL
jgi:hypothetical protein